MDYPVSGVGVALVPCTCGELVQGVLEGEPFLVSCPIDRYSRVRVAVGEGALQKRPEPAVVPEGRDRTTEVVTTTAEPAPKAHLAAGATLALLGYPELPFTLQVDNPLPPSKGFGTSTADVVGAVVAAAAAVGSSLEPAEVARLAVAIEPSDSTMFPGLTFFNHRAGRQWEELGSCPSFAIAVLEFEGDVDTLDYNARLDMDTLRSLEPEHAAALELLWRGLKKGRPEMIGEAATLSARINQQLLPKPELERAISLGQQFGALGVCVAHSGTAMGVIFGQGESQSAKEMLAVARGKLKELRTGWVSRMVGGGARAVMSHREGSGGHARPSYVAGQGNRPPCRDATCRASTREDPTIAR